MTNFDNMIQVLAYMANQCDMFRPILEGVSTLQQENVYLNEQLTKSVIMQNRLQLNATFSADQANFGVMIATMSEEDATTTIAEKEKKKDLYYLIKSVIEVGKDNYDRNEMEYILDFYSMIEKIDFDDYVELWDLIDSQHQEDIIEDEVEEDIVSPEEIVPEDTTVEEIIPEVTIPESEETTTEDIVNEEGTSSAKFFSRLFSADTTK